MAAIFIQEGDKLIGYKDPFIYIQHHAIIWTNANLLLIGYLETNFSEISIKTIIFIHENNFENIVCEMTSISSRPNDDCYHRCGNI